MAARQSRQAKRSGATSRRAPKKQPRRGVPGWLWGLAGLVAGFFLAQYLQQSAPAPLATVLPKPPANAPEQAAPSGQGDDDAADEPKMPTFEFYTLLPESEVIAPRTETVVPPRPQPQVETPPSEVSQAEASPEAADPIAAELVRISEAMERQESERTASGANADGSEATAATDESRYMLQAASFRETGDAERLAGRLRDFGLRANITEVQSGGGETWHRVQVGPYGDRRELNRAQDLMTTQGIEPLLIRLQN